MAVCVLDKRKRPLMPCRPAWAQRLLDVGKAAVYRTAPFSVVLKEREVGAVQTVEIKAAPGSRTTGLALVAEFPYGREVVQTVELAYMGLVVRAALDKRRGRRSRKTRYSTPRYHAPGRSRWLREWLKPAGSSSSVTHSWSCFCIKKHRPNVPASWENL